MSEQNTARTVGLGAMMTGGARVVQRDRQDRDWYPTPADVTRVLLRRHDLSSEIIWEPCCGDGSMANVFEEFGARTVRSDIHPMCEGAMTQDFLTAEKVPEGVTAIVTNPPYKLAPQFIVRAMSFRPRFCAMFLKSTFWHAIRRRNLWETFPPSHVHFLTWRPDFLNLGAPAMDFIWTVWRSDHEGPTTYSPLHR